MLEVGVRGRSDGDKCRSGLVFGYENGRLTVFFLLVSFDGIDLCVTVETLFSYVGVAKIQVFCESRWCSDSADVKINAGMCLDDRNIRSRTRGEYDILGYIFFCLVRHV